MLSFSLGWRQRKWNLLILTESRWKAARACQLMLCSQCSLDCFGYSQVFQNVFMLQNNTCDFLKVGGTQSVWSEELSSSGDFIPVPQRIVSVPPSRTTGFLCLSQVSSIIFSVQSWTYVECGVVFPSRLAHDLIGSKVSRLDIPSEHLECFLLQRYCSEHILVHVSRLLGSAWMKTPSIDIILSCDSPAVPWSCAST